MIRIGNSNELSVMEVDADGVHLDGGEDGEILLPRAVAPPECQAGDSLGVFVYYDSNDRLTATTKTPLAKVGEFAHLRINSMQPIGAFLDWGLPKDLFLPFREQTRELSVGQFVIVYLYIDSSGRISASMRTDKYIDEKPGYYRDGQRVDLFITSETDLGYKAIINGRHLGVLYANEVFRPLVHGERIAGYVKKIREDGKIDLMLTQTGHKDAEDIGERILSLLEQEEGFLPLDDKTSAEIIYETFGVSKKKFKMALGGLLKKGLVRFEAGGIKAH